MSPRLANLAYVVECDPNLDVLLQFRRNIQRILYKTPCLNQEEKHACNPRTRPCLNMGLSAEKSSDHTLQVSVIFTVFFFRNICHNPRGASHFSLEIVV